MFFVFFEVVSASTLSLSKQTLSNICNGIKVNLLISPLSKDCRLGYACPIRTLLQNLFAKFHLCSSWFNIYSYFKKGCRREWRTEVARPKGTVFTLFNMQNFISCVHLTWKWIHQLWTFVLGFLAPKTVEAHAFLNWKTFLVSSYERPIRDLKIRRRRRQRERHKNNRFN